jgi:hypothetical protein
VDPDPHHWFNEIFLCDRRSNPSSCSGEAGNSAPRPQVQEHPRQAGPLMCHCRPRPLCQVRCTNFSSVAHPGCLSLILVLSIPDFGSWIQQHNQKRRWGGKFFVLPFFVATNIIKFVNNFIFEQVKKIFLSQDTKNYRTFYSKFVVYLSNIWVWDLRFEIWDPGKTYSGSRIQGKEGIGSRIQNSKPGFFHD